MCVTVKISLQTMFIEKKTTWRTDSFGSSASVNESFVNLTTIRQIIRFMKWDVDENCLTVRLLVMVLVPLLLFISITLHLIMMTIVMTIASCVMIDLRKNSFNNNTKKKTEINFEEKKKEKNNIDRLEHTRWTAWIVKIPQCSHHSVNIPMMIIIKIS